MNTAFPQPDTTCVACYGADIGPMRLIYGSKVMNANRGFHFAYSLKAASVPMEGTPSSYA